MSYKALGVEFSGSTYQIEVHDPFKECSYWTFFQYNEEGVLKDAFCSCEEEGDFCPHLKTAFLKISKNYVDPWHIRYQNSFFCKLAKLFARKLGYNTNILQENKGVYEAINSLYFSAAALSDEGRIFFDALFEHRKKETPENSLKFSNLSEEEIQRWKEGRPSAKVLFELSFWTDLAKKLFLLQEEKEKVDLIFEENDDQLPCHIFITTKNFRLVFKIRTEDLSELVSAFSTISSPLKIQGEEEKIESITYDPENQVFYLKHHLRKLPEGVNVGNYLYVKNKGFYPKIEQSLLHEKKIEKENIPLFLDMLREKKLMHLVKEYPVHIEKHTLKYALTFDPFWNLHINAYLFEKGDAIFFDHHAFVENKGFFWVDIPLFHPVSSFVSANVVGQFVNRHRGFFHEIPEFTTHVSPVETELSYRMDLEKKLLRIDSQTPFLTKASHDFGDWIYFEKEGFFPKKETRLKAIASGLEIPFEGLGSFLRAYKEELNPFFLQDNPFVKRGLHIGIASASSIFVKPEIVLKEEFKNKKCLFFEEFVWVYNEGFFELPHAMRIPSMYQKEVIYHQNKATHFLDEELQTLKSYVCNFDPRLNKPTQTSFVIDSVVQDDTGKLSLDLNLVSEFGKTSAVLIHDAMQKKQSLFFSEAGALFLKEEVFEWLKSLAFTKEKVIFSPLQFLKFNALFGFVDQTKEGILERLREFSAPKLPILKGFKSHLRPYQTQGLEWLYFLYQNFLSGILCDDMGLGKTHQAMALMAAIINHKTSKSPLFLIVAPTSVIYHWEEKLAQFLPRVNVHLFHGTKRSKRFPKKGVILTTYGILRVEKKTLEKNHFDLAIFDELQVAKNPHSQIHKILAELNADMRLGLTGTPIENTLFELKALFDIVLPGYMPREKVFKETFVVPIEKAGDIRKRELLTRLIKPFVLRRRKKEVLQDLPEKTEDKSYCDLSMEQTELYHSVLETRRQEIVSQIKDSSKPVPYLHIFSLLSTLKQICNHPALFAKDADNYQQYTSGKWDLFTELLSEAMESGQKVVVFTQYLHMLDILKNYIQEKGWGFTEIRGATRERGEALERFRTDPQCKIFLGSLQAAGLGIDLTAASIVILYDRWWNAARENQAIDRVHRIGQKWGVQVYKLITKNTIEEKIDVMITKKGQLMEDVITIDDKETLKTFTRQELLDLLQFGN